jgi:hypothetical protein
MEYITIKHKKGDTFIANLYFYTFVNNIKTPINIAGKTLKLGLYKNIKDANIDAVLSKEIVLPNDINTQAGEYVLTLTATEMNLPIMTYLAEFNIVDGSLVQSTDIFKIEIVQDLIK